MARFSFDNRISIQKDYIDKVKAPKLSERSFNLLSVCVDSINECLNNDNLKKIIHHIISTTSEIYELDGYSKAIETQDWLTSSLILVKDYKVPIPNVIHFIWFGELNHNHVNYMQIWSNSNSGKDINLWYDSECFLSNEFHEILKTYCTQKGAESYESSLLKIQNEAYNFIKTHKKIKLSFDEACIRFLVKKNICNEDLIRGKLITIRDNFEKYNCKVKKVDFRKTINKEDNAIKEVYELEMYLRGNLAAASDIARLVILRLNGGLYVDIDTLPALEGVFNEIYNIESGNDIFFGKIIDALKIEAVLSELYDREVIPFKNKKKIVNSLIYKQMPSYQREQLEHLSCRLQSDVKRINDDVFFKSIRVTKVYKNLATISTEKNIDGVFYSNIIGCEKDSKFIKIVTREMLKRYGYIKKKNCIFLDARVATSYDNYFYSRFLEYRFDEFNSNNFVTIPLSGPGLFVEVMLGISYNLLELDGMTSPMFISSLLQNETIGVGFHSQSMHTPESLDSSWMLKCN